MTRELEIRYADLCGKCRKDLIKSNAKLLLRLMENRSLREVQKLTGIPRATLNDLKNNGKFTFFVSNGKIVDDKSESLCFRTSGNGATDSGKQVFDDVDVVELSKRLKRIGQKVPQNKGPPGKPRRRIV